MTHHPDIPAAVGEFVTAVAGLTGTTEADVILIAHAQLVSMMVTRIGASRTADLCAGVADRIRDLPEVEALALAFAMPAGPA